MKTKKKNIMKVPWIRLKILILPLYNLFKTVYDLDPDLMYMFCSIFMVQFLVHLMYKKQWQRFILSLGIKQYYV